MDIPEDSKVEEKTWKRKHSDKMCEGVFFFLLHFIRVPMNLKAWKNYYTKWRVVERKYPCILFLYINRSSGKWWKSSEFFLVRLHSAQAQHLWTILVSSQRSSNIRGDHRQNRNRTLGTFVQIIQNSSFRSRNKFETSVELLNNLSRSWHNTHSIGRPRSYRDLRDSKVCSVFASVQK